MSAVPGRGAHRTTLYICAGFGDSGRIPVNVSRWNRNRVTVDVEALPAAGRTDSSPGLEQMVRDAEAMERGH